MAKLHFESDDEDVKAKLKQIEKLGVGFKVPLEKAGLYVMRATDKRFRREESPSGAKWKGLADSTKRRRKKGKKRNREPRILKDTGTLRNSIAKKGRKHNIFRLNDFAVEVGTNVPYANVHQFGFSGTVNVKAGHKKVWHRLNRKKTDLLRQEGHPNLAVFAKKSHKNVIERTFKRKAYSYHLNITPRPFLGISEADEKHINRIFNNWADTILKKGS